MKSSVEHKLPSMSYPATYRIRISGHLDVSWSERLGGMIITTSGGKSTPDTTMLEGKLTDQAALTGVLNTLYDLQMPLMSVECLDCTKNEKEGGSK